MLKKEKKLKQQKKTSFGEGTILVILVPSLRTTEKRLVVWRTSWKAFYRLFLSNTSRIIIKTLLRFVLLKVMPSQERTFKRAWCTILHINISIQQCLPLKIIIITLLKPHSWCFALHICIHYIVCWDFNNVFYT